jgi:hypothetical protein
MMGLAGKDGFAIDGKSRPRVRRQAKAAVTKAQRTLFLETLAETCNVLLSAKEAGLRPQRVYDLKARDASFRAGWDQALATGYAQLEMMMLERALHGVEKIVRLPGGKSKKMREYSDRVGLALLRMHREGASIADAEEADSAEVAEACERIIYRLERLRPTEEEIIDGDYVETKSERNRTALIAWATSPGGA